MLSSNVDFVLNKQQAQKVEKIASFVNGTMDIQKEIIDAIKAKSSIMKYTSSNIAFQDEFLDVYADTMSYVSRFDKVPPRHFFASQQEHILESLIEVLAAYINRPFK